MKTSRNKPTQLLAWTTSELIIMTITGFIIGITVCVLFWPTTTIEDHEIVVSNFLGHKELMVIKIKD
jgi:hypothetical protein